jgi:hypothetical protein
MALDRHSKQVGLRLERFDPEYSPLIPDPLVSVPNVSWMVVILVRHHVPILDNGGTGLMGLGSVINDCGHKHYNTGISPGYLYVMQWEAT